MSPNSDTSGRAVAPRPPTSDSLAARCAAHAPISPNGHFLSGTTFGDWRLTAFIGCGGNGEVYCAEHASLGTPAAVKVLMREDERAKARFAREAKLLANLKSDAFPRFFAYGEANGRPYLSMELLEPGELPTGERAIARFLLKVCDAVAELHTLGYVHRDIKPSNILWRTGSGRACRGRTGTTGVPPVAFPVLADLGLVKNVQPSNFPTLKPSNSLTTLGGVGTPGYGAPEQMERGEATVASDIHALGVLADRCFDGKPPRAWARIIQRATSSIPARRYPSVAAFARAIRQRYSIRRLMIACAIAVAVIAATWTCMPFPDANVSQNAGVTQDAHEVAQDVYEVGRKRQEERERKELFQSELSKGWSEMIEELRKFCELGTWMKDEIKRHKDFWQNRDLSNKLQIERRASIKKDVEMLIQNWRIAKERHAEKIRVWSKQAGELGLSAPTSPVEYDRLRKMAEDILENRLPIDYRQF